MAGVVDQIGGPCSSDSRASIAARRIALVGGAASWLLAARAQQGDRVRRIGAIGKSAMALSKGF
jgi:hypothetical protein